VCYHPEDVFSGEAFLILAKQSKKLTLHLSQQHGFVEEESGFWTGLPAVQTFTN